MSKALKVGQRVRGIAVDLHGKHGTITGFVGSGQLKRFAVDWDDNVGRGAAGEDEIESYGKPEAIVAKLLSEVEINEVDEYEQVNDER